ncbi:MAG: hypothetical protein RIF34_03010, partial [Candidatus Kapaibacterium sp.]
MVFSQSGKLSVTTYDSFDSSEGIVPIRYLGKGNENHYFLSGKVRTEREDLIIQEFDTNLNPTGRSWSFKENFDVDNVFIYGVFPVEDRVDMFVAFVKSKKNILYKVTLNFDAFSVEYNEVYSEARKGGGILSLFKYDGMPGEFGVCRARWRKKEVDIIIDFYGSDLEVNTSDTSTHDFKRFHVYPTVYNRNLFWPWMTELWNKDTIHASFEAPDGFDIY